MATIADRTGAYIALYGAYVGLIHLIPGPWHRWSKGDAADMWTLTHLLWGDLARRMGVPFRTFMVLAAGNELAEAGIRRYRPDLLWGTPEPPANVAVDLAANAAGYLWPLAGSRQ